MRRPPTAALLVLLLVLAGCTSRAADPVPVGLDEPARDDVTVDEGDGGDRPVRTRLRPSTSCEDLLAWYVGAATDLVGPFGLGFGGGVEILESAAADSASGRTLAQPSAPVASATRAAAGPAVSGTNVQESGVDEPDLVKTDGRVIVTAVNGRVQVTDVATAAVVGEVPLPQDAWSAELLLDGTDLLVLATGGQGGGPVGPAGLVPAFPAERTTVTRVDLTDPADPQVRGSVRLEGAYRSARMVDGTVRLVVVSQPTGLAFTQPTDGGLAAEEAALEENRRILAASTIDDWVPHLQVVGPDGVAGETRPAFGCTQIAQPADPSGLSTLGVLTFDLRGDGLEPTSGAALVAAGDTVYASTDRLVVATSPWGGWIQPFLDTVRIAPPEPADLTTDLHTFDISDPATTRYVASGSVEGSLIGQFALSEADGIIRVATTTQPGWLGDVQAESQSSLVTLREEGEALVEVGRVDGLGLTEQIQAVRYLSPTLAAIVTFRQTDPLYLVDTSDPANPVVRGELKIPGFSSYLHPMGEGYLLGVGQDADEATGTVLGVQASLFDIRDLANPQRVAQVTFGSGSSPVEWDHRAFLHWAPTGQAVVPIELYGPVQPAPVPGQEILFPEPRPEDQFAGAAVLQVGAGSLAEQGRIAHREVRPGDFGPGIIRSLVVGDDLWTVSYEGLARFDLASLAREATVRIG
jgi:hypothetical protein